MIDPATIERLAREAGGQLGGEFELNVPAPVWVFDAEDLAAFAELVLEWRKTEGWKDEPIPRNRLNGSPVK